MKKYMKEHWMEYAFALLLVGIAGVGISLIFGYSFSTNDDAMLRNIVNGNYTGTPDAHLIYIMYPLGWILKCLYQIAPVIPWYDLLMIGLHYLCWFIFVIRAMQIAKDKTVKYVVAILVLGLVILIDLPYLVMHQYTVLAAVLISAVIFILATGNGDSAKQYWIDRVICLILMTLCLWLRKQVFFMALPIVFLVLIKEIYGVSKDRKIKRRIKNVIIFFGGFACVLLLTFMIEHLAYSSPEWKEFEIYNEARTDIYDYYGIPKFEEYKQEYEALGIDYGEWVVFDHYDTGLISGLSADKMKTIAEWSMNEKMELQQQYNVFRQCIYSVVNILFYNDVQPAGLILSILYVVTLLYVYRNRDRVGFLCVCGMLLFQMVFIGYFIEQGRFPERISYGLYFMQICYLAGIVSKGLSNKNFSWKKEKFWTIAIIGLCVVTLSILGIYRVRMTLNECNEITAEVKDWEYVNDYFDANTDNKYCIVTNSFVFSKELMFGNPKVESDNLIRLGVWVQNSPLEKEHNERLGVFEIGEYLLSAQDIYLVADAEMDLWWLDSYLSGTDKCAVVTETIVTPGGRQFAIIQVQ